MTKPKSFVSWLMGQNPLQASLIRQRARREEDRPFMVNIRDGELVGTDGPDVPNGTYVRVDDLPSDGGRVFRAIKTQEAQA
jgi:hypothetical protein